MAKKFYYTRNPESIGGADARFQDDWGFKHKEDDIKWVNAELVDGLVEAARKAVDKHRELPNVGCPEDCWCWDLDNAISKYEAKLTTRG